MAGINLVTQVVIKQFQTFYLLFDNCNQLLLSRSIPTVPNFLHLISHLVQTQNSRFPSYNYLIFASFSPPGERRELSQWGPGRSPAETNLGHVKRCRTPAVVEGKSDIL